MEISPWMGDATEAAPPLTGDVEADVAVVGAGFTGLSAALALRAEGLSTVIVEREVAGFGASGRNAGHLTPTIGKDLPTLARFFGRERARALVALVQTAIAHVEETIARHGIDCAYEPVGNVMAAVHPHQHAMLDRAARAGAELGLDGELLAPAAMRRRGLPRAFTRGYLLRRGGILHPGRYVRGLRRAALAAGAVLHERTPVVRVEDGEPAVVHTPKGRVRARAVVLATNAYTPELGWLGGTIARLHVYLFATAPLAAAQKAAVGRTGARGNIYYSAGYAGHGIPLASYAGTMLADLVLGRDGPGRALWSRRRIPLPPEPLRWLVVHGITTVLGAIDRRVDRAARARPPDEHQGAF